MEQAAYLIEYPSKCEQLSKDNLEITSLPDSVFKPWLQTAITFEPVELQRSACTQIERLWLELKGSPEKV